MLRPCDKCKENSCARRVYTTKDGSRRVVEYCINKNCGYSYGWEIPIQNAVEVVLSTEKEIS